MGEKYGEVQSEGLESIHPKFRRDVEFVQLREDTVPGLQRERGKEHMDLDIVRKGSSVR